MSANELDIQIIFLAIGLVVAQVLFGLALQLRRLWRFRISLAVLSIVSIGFLIGLVVMAAPFYAATAFIIVQAYVVFHWLRFIKKGANLELLAHKGWRTQLVFGIFNLVAIILWALQDHIELVFGWLVLAQLLTAAWLLLHTVSSYRKTKPLVTKKYKSDNELPTLTVAIPARNETQELTDTLEALLDNDYPKLEILVLDDCSQDNTSDIIRSFAHRGVRFLKGLDVNDKWLAKNYAYDQLMDNSSGQYILFCGVDVRFDKQSLRTVMNEMLESKLGMMCILPRRPAELNRYYLLQPMRYWRELAFPRFYKTTPPALSTCWVANRKKLQKLGGFEGLRRTIRPERFIARSFNVKSEYRFVRSSSEMAVSSVKSLPAQWQTALRTRYPELKSRPDIVLFTAFWQLTLLLGPFLGILYGLAQADPLVIVICLTAVILLGLVHGLVFYMTTNKVSLAAIALLPVSIVMELVVVNYSMWAYEFSKVLWKGRNICLPVMQVYTRLPKL